MYISLVFLTSAFLLYLVGLVVASRPIRECNETRDCRMNECCVAPSFRRGKRSIQGTCVKLGRIGRECYVSQTYAPSTIYEDYCPCKRPFTCKKTDPPVNVVPQGFLGTCRISLTSDTLDMPCSSGTQCGPSECCVSNVRPIGKRSTEAGTCKQMGTSGSDCLVNAGSGKPTELTFVNCPCSTGLTCIGSGQFDIPLGETGTCQVISDTLDMPCSSGTQCGPSECCVSNVRPIGKRSTEAGTCKQMGTSGSDCLVNAGSGKPTELTFVNCPCSTGLTCIGSGQFDIPLGETGTCQVISDTLDMPCSSGTQCGPSECCVSNVRPIGKRSTEAGTCKQMGTSGSDCLVNAGSGKPTELTFVNCPCSTGLTCIGSGEFDIPLGETDAGDCIGEPLDKSCKLSSNLCQHMPVHFVL